MKYLKLNQMFWNLQDLNFQHAGYEQRKWEEEHLSQATLSFGAKDAKERHKKKEKEYEYILDDEIEFVQALKMPGTKKDDGEKEMSEFEKKKMSIAETKRSLPVYPFREDLIAAVREHQVWFWINRILSSGVYILQGIPC